MFRKKRKKIRETPQFIETTECTMHAYVENFNNNKCIYVSASWWLSNYFDWSETSKGMAGWIVVACYLNDTGGDIHTCIYCITITNFKRDTSKYLYNIWKRTQLTSINLWIILAGYESRVTFNNGHGSVKSKYRQRLSVSIVLKLHIGRQNACSSVTGNFCWS